MVGCPACLPEIAGAFEKIGAVVAGYKNPRVWINGSQSPGGLRITRRRNEPARQTIALGPWVARPDRGRPRRRRRRLRVHRRLALARTSHAGTDDRGADAAERRAARAPAKSCQGNLFHRRVRGERQRGRALSGQGLRARPVPGLWAVSISARPIRTRWMRPCACVAWGC